MGKLLKILIAATLVVLLLVVVSALFSDTEEPVGKASNAAAKDLSATPAPTVSTVETPAPAPSEVAVEPLTDDGWRVESVSLEDFFGYFGGTSRVVNETGSNVTSAIFTLTVLDGTEVVASLMGSANNVGAGESATVEWTGTDSFVPRSESHTMEFQVDWSQ